jgi:hypothetical protein
MRKKLKLVLFGFLVLITLIALAWAIENARGYHAWKKYRKEWEARGEVFEMAKLIPPEVPDEKNFAMTPLLKPLFQYTIGSNSMVWMDTNGLERLEHTGPELEVRNRTNNLSLGNVEQGTFADLATCADYYRGNTNFPQVADEHSGAAQVILTALKKFAPEISELKEAAHSRPYSRFPVHYTEEPYWNILLRHLAHIKGLTQLTQMRAVAELELGDNESALADLKLGMRVADSIQGEPLLISDMVRAAATSINAQTVREGLVRHRWTPDQLKELEAYYAQLDFLHDYKTAMRGERAFCLGGIDYMRRKGWKAASMQVSDEKSGQMMDSGPLWILPSGWCYQNMLNVSRFHQQFTLPAVDENARRVNPQLTKEGITWVNSQQRGPYNIFLLMLAPALDKAVLHSARAQTLVDETRVACALARYRLEKGTLPEALSALTPEFLKSVPADLFDGQPLRYRREQDGSYHLYSIGWNEKDDGGEMALKEGKAATTRGSVDATRGDWVWSMPVSR